MPRRTVIYQLATATTVTAAGTAQLTVIQPGTIIGTFWRSRGTGGAGVGAIAFECDLNQATTSFAETNNPQRDLAISSHTAGFGNGTQVLNPTGPFIPQSRPVRAGDIISINTTQTGTAPASQVTTCQLIVDEEG